MAITKLTEILNIYGFLKKLEFPKDMRYLIPFVSQYTKLLSVHIHYSYFANRVNGPHKQHLHSQNSTK